MKLQILLTLFLQVALVESLREISGYLGDTITLPSGVDPSWNLSSIVWSIFSNNTWIATYHNGKENIKRVDRYKGRLSLNTSSGDLMIHDLTPEDEMEYTVDLINTEGQNSGDKTKLTVRQRLQKPTIEIISCAPVKGGCWLWLHCSSVDKGVDLSWQGKPPTVTFFNMSNPDGSSAVLRAFLNTTQNSIEFTCASSRNMEKASSVVTPKCDDSKTQPHPQEHPQSRGRYAVGFLLGGILGGSLTVVIIYFLREKFKAALRHEAKLSPSNDNNVTV